METVVRAEAGGTGAGRPAGAAVKHRQANKHRGDRPEPKAIGSSD